MQSVPHPHFISITGSLCNLQGLFQLNLVSEEKEGGERGRGINRQSLIASDEETEYAKSEVFFFLCVQALPIHKRLSKLFSMEIHDMDLLYI